MLDKVLFKDNVREQDLLYSNENLSEENNKLICIYVYRNYLLKLTRSDSNSFFYSLEMLFASNLLHTNVINVLVDFFALSFIFVSWGKVFIEACGAFPPSNCHC